MTKHGARLIVGLAAGVMVGTAALGSWILGDRASDSPSPMTDNVRVIDDRKLPEKWAINAAYGRGALSNLRAALTEIADDDAEEARKRIVLAQSLLAKIEPQRSNQQSNQQSKTVVVPPDAQNTAVAGDIELPEDLILIHSEVRLLGAVDPQHTVRAKLERIRSELAMNDHEAIIAALDSLNVPLTYTRVDLPLSETVTLVNGVLQAFDARDAELARSKLMQVEDALLINTVYVGIEDAPVESTSVNDAG